MSTGSSFSTVATEVVATAGQAARHMAFLTGHKLQILRQKEHIRQLYARLGKLCYKDRITDTEPDEAEYQPLCDAISDAYRCISRLRDEMEEAKEACRSSAQSESPQQDEDDVEIIPLTEQDW